LVIVPNDRWLLYVVECAPYLKIGISGNMKKRLHDMKLLNPMPLSLIHYRLVPRRRSRLVEAAVHAALADYAHGREWFTVPIETARETIARIIDADKIAHNWTSYVDDSPVTNAMETLAFMRQANPWRVN